MKNNKRLLSILILLICTGSLWACSNGQREGAYEAKSNLPLEKETTSYHTKSALCKDYLLFDGNGDGVDDHIVEHSLLDIFGGHGSYELYVYAKSITGKYDEIFNSYEYLSIHKNIDLKITAIRNGKIVFCHEETGYETEYMIEEKDYPYLFNTDGTLKETSNFVVDTFKTVEAIDVDHDGTNELVMRQYASIGYHANYFADVETVFKISDNELILISIELITDDK